jgi:tetratricopeptide (TPR) repeat protein
MFALAKEYEKIGTLKKALDTYNTLRENDPDYVGLYYHLAALQLELSMPEKAIETYDKGIEIAKKVADFHALSELHTARMNLDVD